jgi:hypothetical protein
MSANHGAVSDRSRLVYVDSQLSEDLGPNVLPRPVSEPVVDALPLAESVGKVAPLDSGLRAKDDSVDEQPVTTCRLTSLWARRQQRLQPGPLLISQRVPLHEQL